MHDAQTLFKEIDDSTPCSKILAADTSFWYSFRKCFVFRPTSLSCFDLCLGSWQSFIVQIVHDNENSCFSLLQVKKHLRVHCHFFPHVPWFWTASLLAVFLLAMYMSPVCNLVPQHSHSLLKLPPRLCSAVAFYIDDAWWYFIYSSTHHTLCCIALPSFFRMLRASVLATGRSYALLFGLQVARVFTRNLVFFSRVFSTRPSGFLGLTLGGFLSPNLWFSRPDPHAFSARTSGFSWPPLGVSRHDSWFFRCLLGHRCPSLRVYSSHVGLCGHDCPRIVVRPVPTSPGLWFPYLLRPEFVQIFSPPTSHALPFTDF